MQPSLFLVVEFAATDLPLSGFTARHPGSSIDLISEPAVEEGNDRVHPSIMLVKGASRASLRELMRSVGDVYAPVHTLEADEEGGTWLARLHVRESVLAGRGAAVLAGFQHRFGVPWSHLEHGILHMRARIEDPERAGVLADQVRLYLGKQGVEAQVEVQELSARDYGVWEDLVQHTIGLAP